MRGWTAARAELVAVLDGDGSIDPGVLPGMAALVAVGEADLVVGRRVPQAGAWPWHARAGNAVIAATLRRRGVGVRDLAPSGAASRAALLGLGVRRPELRLPARAAAARRSGGLADLRGPGALPGPGRRAVEGLGVAARHGAGGPGHGGAVAMREPDGPTLGLLVLAKAPETGRVKTRLCPPLTLAEAADLAAAALLDTLGAVRGVPGGRVVVALAGRLSAAARAVELAAQLRGVATRRQRGPDLGYRIAAAHGDVACLLPGCPVLQLGMDTPQVEPGLLTEAAGPLRRGIADAVLGPAADGGWWALGLRDPRAASAVADVPTSRDDTGERTLRALRAAGLRVGLLPELTDVDTASDATAVARIAPWTRFAAAVAGLPALSADPSSPVGSARC